VTARDEPALRRILVALDASRTSLDALRAAAALAARLGAEHGLPVVHLDHEDLRQVLRLTEHRGERAQLHPESLGAFVEQPGHLVGRQPRHQREPGLERGEVAHRGAEQLGQPVLELGDPGLGDLVDRALGPAAGAAGLTRPDQAVLLQRLDHRVERAVVELDAELLAPAAQRGGDLVRVHRALVQAAQHRQSQRVGHPSTGHGYSPSVNTRTEVFVMG